MKLSEADPEPEPKMATAAVEPGRTTTIRWLSLSAIKSVVLSTMRIPPLLLRRDGEDPLVDEDDPATVTAYCVHRAAGDGMCGPK